MGAGEGIWPQKGAQNRPILGPQTPDLGPHLGPLFEGFLHAWHVISPITPAPGRPLGPPILDPLLEGSREPLIQDPLRGNPNGGAFEQVPARRGLKRGPKIAPF